MGRLPVMAGYNYGGPGGPQAQPQYGQQQYPPGPSQGYGMQAPPAQPQERSPTVKNHDGSQPDPSAVEFGTPTTIGQLVSVTSGLGPGGKPFSAVDTIWSKRIFLGLLVGIAVAVVGFLVVAQIAALIPHFRPDDYQIGAIVLGGVAWIVAGALIKRSPTRCTFIGTEGIARASRTWKGVVGCHEVRFADVPQVRVRQTRRLRNGSYQHTSFDYSFFDGRGNRQFLLSGFYNDTRQESKFNDIHFAKAAEKAHGAFVFPHVLGALDTQQGAHFDINSGRGHIRVFRAGLELRSGTTVFQLPLNQAQVTIRRGNFQVKGRQGGNLSCGFDEIGNAQVLLVVLGKLGVTID